METFIWGAVLSVCFVGSPFAISLWLIYVNREMAKRIEREMLWMK